jgi:hypothetical protein
MNTDFWDVIAVVWYMENLKIRFILQVSIYPTKYQIQSTTVSSFKATVDRYDTPLHSYCNSRL